MFHVNGDFNYIYSKRMAKRVSYSTSLSFTFNSFKYGSPPTIVKLKTDTFDSHDPMHALDHFPCLEDSKKKKSSWKYFP